MGGVSKPDQSLVDQTKNNNFFFYFPFLTPNIITKCLELLLHIWQAKIQILAWRPGILTEVFVVFLSISRKMQGQPLNLGHNCLPYISFLTRYSLVILSSSTIESELRAPLNKPQKI
jgi:hypothetical protein